jgi:hypothetical protein
MLERIQVINVSFLDRQFLCISKISQREYY